MTEQSSLAALPDPTPEIPCQPELINIAVVGAHLCGMPLNHELTTQGGHLVLATRTAPLYRLFELPGTKPPKPGLLRVGEDAGAAIEVEVWALPCAAFGRFVALIPGPLGIGSLILADGTETKGFLCEEIATRGAEDITEYGGWRTWVAARKTASAIA